MALLLGNKGWGCGKTPVPGIEGLSSSPRSIATFLWVPSDTLRYSLDTIRYTVTISYMSHTCDYCEKPLERKMFCSSSCRVADHRKGGRGRDKFRKEPRVPSQPPKPKLPDFPIPPGVEVAHTSQSPLEEVKLVPSPPKEVPVVMKESWSLPAPTKKVGKQEALTPFAMCPTHKGFYKSCHC